MTTPAAIRNSGQLCAQERMRRDDQQPDDADQHDPDRAAERTPRRQRYSAVPSFSSPWPVLVILRTNSHTPTPISSRRAQQAAVEDMEDRDIADQKEQAQPNQPDRSGRKPAAVGRFGSG